MQWDLSPTVPRASLASFPLLFASSCRSKPPSHAGLDDHLATHLVELLSSPRQDRENDHPL